MQKSTNSKQYQELERELKPFSFSKEGYEKTQAIRSEIVDLTNDVDNLNKQLQGTKTSSELPNKEKIQALVDHKAGVLHWESENKDSQRQIEAAKKDLQSYDQLQPEAVRLSKLSSEVRGQMRSDYQALNSQKQEANNLPTIVLLILLVVGIFSVIAISNLFIRFLGVMVALGGLGLFVWIRQRNAQVGRREQAFIEKYGLNLNAVDLDSLWNEAVQTESKKQLLTQLGREQKSLSEKVQAFVQKLYPPTQKKIQTLSEIASQLNSLREALDQSSLAKQHLSDLIIQLQDKKNQLAKNKIESSKSFAVNKVANFAEFTDLKRKTEE